jgi:hypothetical protein
MKTLAAAFALALLAGPAFAQATPPAGSSPPSPSASTTDSQTAPAGGRDGMRHGRGAYIKMQGPGGAEVAVRCADGETTRACADVVLQLLDRARSGSSERRRDFDRDSRNDDMRGGYRGRDY